MPRGVGPSAGTNPRPLYVNMIRGLWRPYVIGWSLWAPLLGVLLYFKIARGMPTPWYVAALIGLILLALIPSALIFPVWIVRLQRRVTAAGGRICPNCLYDLRTLDDAAVCPECGWDIAAEPPDRLGTVTPMMASLTASTSVVPAFSTASTHMLKPM